MTSLKSIKRINRSTLFYGPSGSWKTTMLGHAAEDSRTAPILVLNFEGGANVLLGSQATVVQIANLDDLSEQFSRLASSLDEEYDVPYEILDLGSGSIKKVKYGDFRSIALDSMSELYVKMLLDRAAQRVQELTGKSADVRRLNQYVLEQSDYGIALNQLRVIIREFRDNLNRHFFMTALPKTELVANEGAVRMPKLDGQAAEEVAGAVDNCIYISSQKGIKKSDDEKQDVADVRIMALNNFPGIRAKTRGGWKQKVPNHIQFSEDDNPITLLFDALGIKE